MIIRFPIIKQEKMNNIIKKIAKCIVSLALIVATIEANIACPYITYQPHKPESVRRLRKF